MATYETVPNVRCRSCGSEEVGVKAHAVGYDFCRSCYATGNADALLRADQIDRFRKALPGWEIAVEHTGGGCFWMAFTPPDAGGYFYTATDGEACLPEIKPDGAEASVPIRDGWGYVGRHFYDADDPEASDAHPDYEGTTIAEPRSGMTTATYVGAGGVERTYETYSDDYWNEYPKHCLTDAEIVEAMKADWEKVGS